MIGDGVRDRRPGEAWGEWDLVFGGQTPPTGGEVGLRAGRPWSVACESLRPGDASAVLQFVAFQKFGFESSNVWKWFLLSKNVEYSNQKSKYAEYKRAYCFKCFSDGIDPQKGSVVFCDSTQGTTSMTCHISKYNAVEEAPILQNSEEKAERFRK